MIHVVIILLFAAFIYFYSVSAIIPYIRFRKAEKLYNMLYYTKAATLYSKILKSYDKAPIRLAKCKLAMGINEKDDSIKIKYFNEVLNLHKQNKKSSLFDLYEAEALYEIANIQYINAYDDVDEISKNIEFIKAVNKKGVEAKFKELESSHYAKLSDIYYKKGLEEENLNYYLKAIDSYSLAKESVSKCHNIRILNWSIGRIGICELKLGNSPSVKELPVVTGLDNKYKTDFYYRYTIHLIKNKEYCEAEAIIAEHINISSPNIDKLREVIAIKKVNRVVLKVDELNVAIEKMYNDFLTLQELENLYSTLLETIEQSRGVDYCLIDALNEIEPTLYNRLLSTYIFEDYYFKAIDLIKQYPNFWESHRLLKNLGICCFKTVSRGFVNESNYQFIISSWLTAVFCDDVIINSLEETLWDDDYNFTLIDSIGSNKISRKSILLYNINYDDISETNISIGATQRELLQQFETILQKKVNDNSLSGIINQFYDKEKEAIKDVIKIIDKEILFSAPYFSKEYDLNYSIIELLDDYYKRCFDEKILLYGVDYVKYPDESFVYQYHLGLDFISNVSVAIEKDDSDSINALRISDQKQYVEKFDDISSLFDETIYNNITNKISENDNNEKLIYVMGECIHLLKDNQYFKHQYSHYVANFCIRNVNNETLYNHEALSLMVDAYLHSLNDSSICKNLVTLIKFNLMDIVNNRVRERPRKDTYSSLCEATDIRFRRGNSLIDFGKFGCPFDVIYPSLDRIIRNMSNTYKENCTELRELRREVLLELKKSGADISFFLKNYQVKIPTENNNHSAEKIYDSYIVMGPLNSRGSEIKKAIAYMKILGNDNSTMLQDLKKYSLIY